MQTQSLMQIFLLLKQKQKELWLRYQEAGVRAEVGPVTWGCAPRNPLYKRQVRPFICPGCPGSVPIAQASSELLALLIPRRQELPSMGPGCPLAGPVHPDRPSAMTLRSSLHPSCQHPGTKHSSRCTFQ